MATSRNDSYTLAQDATFQHRVTAALQVAASNIINEARTVPAGFPAWAVANYYDRRYRTGTRIMQTGALALVFAAAVAEDATVLADATAGGTVALTTANVLAQAALVTDAHIDSAIGGLFNSFLDA